MPFVIKVAFYKSLMVILGLVIKVIPTPRPLIYSGEGSSLSLCGSIIYSDLKSVLIVTDSVLNELGLIDPIKHKLMEAGADVHIYDGVEPNPTFKQVNAGLDMAKSHQCDCVLAFGGGSPIDVAKVISLAASNDKTAESLVGFFKAKNPGLPLYAVPTTAGTGSEVSVAAVISDSETHEKGMVADPKSVPLAAALDPALMVGLPGPITAATGMDALTHAVESYLAAKMPNQESERYASIAAKLIFENLLEAYSNGNNIRAREAMAVASCYAAMAFNRTGLGYVHGIAHQFGGHYDTPHGLANAIVMPYVLDFQKDVCRERLATLGVITGQASANDDETVQCQKFIAAVRQLAEDLGIPNYLEALQEEDIPTIAKSALKESHYTYFVPKYMDQNQCEALIRRMLR